MPFRFTLAAVLLVRENAEEREERALKKLQIELTQLFNQVEELSSIIVKAFEARERAMQRPISALELQSLLWQAEEAAEKKAALLHRIQILEQERDLQMKVYQAAHRDREMLTDMLNKQRDAYEQEQARSQQKHIDDIFMARHHRS